MYSAWKLSLRRTESVTLQVTVLPKTHFLWLQNLHPTISSYASFLHFLIMTASVTPNKHSPCLELEARPASTRILTSCQYRKRRDAATAIKQCFFPEQWHWLFRRLNSDSTRCKHMRLCRCPHFSGHWPTHRLRPCLSVCRYLVGVEHFAGEWIVFQGAGGAGAAVVQHFTAVLHLLFVLSLQICCYLRMQDRHLREGHKSTAHILQNYSTVELEFLSYGEWRIVGTEVVPALVLQLLHHLVHRTLQPRFNRDSRLP